jgi:hypothetical protein
MDILGQMRQIEAQKNAENYDEWKRHSVCGNIDNMINTVFSSDREIPTWVKNIDGFEAACLFPLLWLILCAVVIVIAGLAMHQPDHIIYTHQYYHNIRRF